MGQDFYYAVNIQNISCDDKDSCHRFKDKSEAKSFALAMVDMLDSNNTLFNIDVYYVSSDRMKWITGYSNL